MEDCNFIEVFSDPVFILSSQAECQCVITFKDKASVTIEALPTAHNSKVKSEYTIEMK